MALTQTSFRVRNDDGNETTATWVQATNTNASLNVDTTYRLRHLISEDGDFSALDDRFQYNLAAAGWVNITTTSSVVKAVASANVTDDGATTEQLAGAGSFIAGKITEDGLCASTSLSPGEDLEDELVFQIVSGDVTNGQTLQIRSTAAGSALAAYTNTVTITVVEAAATSTPTRMTMGVGT